MDFAKEKKLIKTPTDISCMIEEILSSLLLSGAINEQKIKVVRDYNFDAEIVIDPQRIKQVLQNIITNAVQSIVDTGTLTITTTKAVDGGWERGDGKAKEPFADFSDFIEIKISDTGCGMKEETLSHIFEPLYTTKIKGIGLGLAIVKDIIDAHNGKITVNSEENKGTEFTVVLPKWSV